MATQKTKSQETESVTTKRIVEDAIISTIKESKDRSLEIFITSLFVCVGLVFYAMGFESLLTLSVLLFGALWNFFTSSNRFFAVIFSFLVCVPYALVSLAAGLYGQAFLHILLYLPTQLMFYQQERKNTDNSIQKDNKLSTRTYAVMIVFALVLMFSLSLVLYNIESQVLFWFDAISVVLLAVSMFLVNGRFTAYWVQRIIAVAVSAGLWITHGILFNWVDGSIMFALLFGMYLIVDSYRFALWYRLNYPKHERLAKKLEKIKDADKKESKQKEIKASKKLPS